METTVERQQIKLTDRALKGADAIANMILHLGHFIVEETRQRSHGHGTRSVKKMDFQIISGRVGTQHTRTYPTLRTCGLWVHL